MFIIINQSESPVKRFRSISINFSVFLSLYSSGVLRKLLYHSSRAFSPRTHGRISGPMRLRYGVREHPRRPPSRIMSLYQYRRHFAGERFTDREKNSSSAERIPPKQKTPGERVPNCGNRSPGRKKSPRRASAKKRSLRGHGDSVPYDAVWRRHPSSDRGVPGFPALTGRFTLRLRGCG